MSGRAATDTVIPGRYALSVGNPGTIPPRGWTWIALTDISDLGTGHTPSRQYSEYWDGTVPWIGIRDAGRHHGGVINDTVQHISEAGLRNSSARLLPELTVCLSRTASVGYVLVMGRPMATSQDFVTWSCTEALDPFFLMKALLAEGDHIKKFGEGSTHTTIYFPEVKAFHLCLPSIGEQRRIVSKIDGLSLRSRRAREDITRIQSLVERAKQAVLSKVVDGQVFNENEAFETYSLSQLTQPSAPICYGVVQPGEIVSDGVPLVRVCDLSEGRVLWDELRFISREISAEYVRSTISDDDILVSLVGTIGRVAIVEGSPPSCNIARALARIRVQPDLCDARWLAYMLRSPQYQSRMLSDTREVARKTLNLSLLREMTFRTPQLSEQREIVQRIETAFARIDTLASEAVSAGKLLDRLDQAILAKAFRGELVPQDPKDEPASILLERIRVERVLAADNIKARRGRPARQATGAQR